MSLLELKRRVLRLTERERLDGKKPAPLSNEMADIILRELLCGEPPTYFSEEQVRAFTATVLNELHGSASGQVSP